jgi:hypothetical protein
MCTRLKTSSAELNHFSILINGDVRFLMGNMSLLSLNNAIIVAQTTYSQTSASLGCESEH